MKYLIASDIHGSAYYCARLLQDFAREQADRLVLLGDICTTALGMTCPGNMLPSGSLIC